VRQALEAGECELAGSVGINLTLVHSWTRACLRAGMLSEEGRCRTLDADADGYVRAEGVGAAMLARFPPADQQECKGGPGAALAWQSLVLLVGSAVNQDGRSSSLTAPNGPSQQEAMQAALRSGDRSAFEVAHLQMHGTGGGGCIHRGRFAVATWTRGASLHILVPLEQPPPLSCCAGTSLGDPIEVGAAVAVLLKPGVAREAALQLTAAKSFMGHAEPAAGIVGIAKLSLILGHQLADPILHLRTVNHYVASAGERSSAGVACGVWRVAAQLPAHGHAALHCVRPCLADWAMLVMPPSLAVSGAASHGTNHRISAPRQLSTSVATRAELLGGVSSFAFQGTNAHAILGKLTDRTFALPGPSPAFVSAAASQQARFWVLPAAHSLVGCVSSGGAGGQRVMLFECSLLAARQAMYSDHQVFGRVLFPGAGMMEAALAAASTALDGPGSRAALAVAGMAIISPLIIPPPEQQPAPGVRMHCSLVPATGDIQLAEQRGRGASTPCAHGGVMCAAAATAAVRAAAAMVAYAQARRLLPLGREAAATALAGGKPQGKATGSIAVDRKLGADGYLVPPPCMDACLHLGVAVPGCGAKVPIAVGAFVLADSCAAAGTELAGSTSAAYRLPSGGSEVSSFALHTSLGGAFASLADLETKVTKPKSTAPTSVQPADFLYEVDWQAAGLADSEQQPRPSAAVELGGSSLSLDFAAGPRQAATGALAVIQHAQTAQAPAVGAWLPETLPRGLAAGFTSAAVLAAGAVEGLLRVAATEHAAAQYRLAVTDAQAASPLPGSSSQQPDMGILNCTRVHGTVSSIPHLLPR
jgi:hypothetical protein